MRMVLLTALGGCAAGLYVSQNSTQVERHHFKLCRRGDALRRHYGAYFPRGRANGPARDLAGGAWGAGGCGVFEPHGQTCPAPAPSFRPRPGGAHAQRFGRQGAFVCPRHCDTQPARGHGGGRFLRRRGHRPRAFRRAGHHGAEHPRGHGRHFADAARGHQPPAHAAYRHVYRAYRGRRHAYRLCGGNCIRAGAAFPARLCGRDDALCDMRRNDSRDPFPRLRAAGLLRAARRLPFDAGAVRRDGMKTQKNRAFLFLERPAFLYVLQSFFQNHPVEQLFAALINRMRVMLREIARLAPDRIKPAGAVKGEG